MRYSYLASGLIASINIWNITLMPAVHERTITYTYDPSGHITGLTDSAAGPVPFQFDWDPVLEQITRRTLPSGAWQDTTRDSLGQTTTQSAYTGQTASNGLPLMDYRYSYNTAGLRTSLNDHSPAAGATIPPAAPTATAYTYDPIHQVKTVAHAGTAEEAFTWDALGNRLSATLQTATTAYTPNAVNQYSAIAAQPQTADPAGNMLNLTGPGTRDLRLTWDDQNQLIRAENHLTGHASEYAYNTAGQRVEERRYATLTASDPVETIRLLYHGWSPIAHYRTTSPGGGTRPANATVINQSSPLPPSSFILHTSQTWGPDLSGSLTATGGVGALLAITESVPAVPSGVASNTVYPLYDPLGNIQHLLDATGTERARYRYSAFGQFLAATGDLAAANPWRFSTKEADLCTSGFSYYGYRWYDAEAGRWPSRDPIGERGGLNLYGFVGNDGVNFIDVMGNAPMSGGVGGPQFIPPGGFPSAPPTQTDLANEEFNRALKDFAQGNGGNHDYGPDSPWTKELAKKPVYDRMRTWIKDAANKACADNTVGDMLNKQKPWDDSADDHPIKGPIVDGFNYIFEVGLQSTGSTEGNFTITQINCCGGQVCFNVEVTDELRMGSATRIPGTSKSLIPDIPSCVLPFCNNQSIKWHWSECISFP